MIIEVTASGLREYSTNLKGYGTEFFSCTEEIRNLMKQQVKIGWEGSAANAFFTQFESLDKSMQTYKDVIDEYAKFLIDAANDYEQAENAAAAQTDTLAASGLL